MKRANIAFALGLISLSSLAAQAAPAPLQGTGKVEFVAIGRPSAVKIHGEGSGLTSTLAFSQKSVQGHFDFPVDQFDTGIDMRTRHMKEKYLETGKFPKASLELTSVTLPQSPTETGFNVKDVPFQGNLTLHGVTKPVQGHFNAEAKSGKIAGTADFDVKTTDFGIEIPKYLGITVADNVQVHVNFEAPQTATK